MLLFLRILRKPATNVCSFFLQVVLPDMEFFVNLGDWPLVKHKTNPLPILSWCGSDDTLDIVMPTYDLTESALETMGRSESSFVSE